MEFFGNRSAGIGNTPRKKSCRSKQSIFRKKLG